MNYVILDIPRSCFRIIYIYLTYGVVKPECNIGYVKFLNVTN